MLLTVESVVETGLPVKETAERLSARERKAQNRDIRIEYGKNIAYIYTQRSLLCAALESVMQLGRCRGPGIYAVTRTSNRKNTDFENRIRKTE